MAKGFFNDRAKHAIADSAGTMPAGSVDAWAIAVMKEVGIDISLETPKSITPEMNDEFDYIVTMGCIDGCPLTPRDKTIEWNIEDPKGLSLDRYRDIRDEIKEHVNKLIKTIS
jgi:protein-tyrosine-phosphatase